jgi:hypothetical protein
VEARRSILIRFAGYLATVAERKVGESVNAGDEMNDRLNKHGGVVVDVSWFLGSK